MRFGDEVIVTATSQHAKVLRVGVTEVKVKIYGVNEPVVVSRYAVRVLSAHDRDGGKIDAVGALSAMFLASLILLVIFAPRRADSPVTHPSPTPSVTTTAIAYTFPVCGNGAETVPCASREGAGAWVVTVPTAQGWDVYTMANARIRSEGAFVTGEVPGYTPTGDDVKLGA